MTSQDDKELLAILHAHGRRFLNTFDLPVMKNDSEDPESEEEWTGFSSSSDGGSSETASEDGNNDNIEHEDDDFTASSSRTPDVTMFSELSRQQADASLSIKTLRKSFMSAKVCNVTSSPMQPAHKQKIPDEESEDERTNTQNDALLHRLVHTKLLSGSLNPELDLNHAERGRALAGRVLELAGKARFGTGESVFRQEQRHKAAKRVRDGLIRKQKEQEKRALEEAKNLGNYHPILKRVYDSNPFSTPKKKRVRGLGMGIGRFAGGILKLSQDEIASVTGSGKQLRGDGPRRVTRSPHVRKEH